MVRATLICTDSRCPSMFEATGALDAVESLCCDCRELLEVIAWYDEPEPARDAAPELVLLSN